MLTPEEGVMPTNIVDRLIELYTRRAEACGQEDWHRVRSLEREISEQIASRQSLLVRVDSQGHR